MTQQRKNVGASVRDRLLQLARNRREDFQLVLLRYANERLLYRLSQTPHAAHFVLKGATLFTIWTEKPHRATRDLDLLGTGRRDAAAIREVFAETLAVTGPDDGVRFDSRTVVIQPIAANRDFGGHRVLLRAHVTTAEVRLQIDIGFGCPVTPGPVTVELPSLLGFPAPRVLAYPRETVVAEKLEAMVKRGLANSRMKDFHDVAMLAEQFAFAGPILLQAVRATFASRQTAIPTSDPTALTPAFYADPAKLMQWAGFVRKTGASGTTDLPHAAAAVKRFACPVFTAAGDAGNLFELHWPPGGPWS